MRFNKATEPGRDEALYREDADAEFNRYRRAGDEIRQAAWDTDEQRQAALNVAKAKFELAIHQLRERYGYEGNNR